MCQRNNKPIFSYIIAALIGGIAGAIIGQQIVFSIGLSVILIHGYYIEDDILFYSVEPSLLLGVPIGCLVGIGMNIFLVRRGVHLKRIAVWLGIASLLSFYLTNYLEEKIRPPLVKAAALNNLGQVQTAIKSGANLNVRDISNQTALIAASQKGYVDIVNALIQAGSDLNVKDDNGLTPLMVAIEGTGLNKGHPQIAKALIQAGADVNIKNIRGLTALMMAASVGDAVTVEALVKAGADINARDDRGVTALSIAIQEGHTKIVQILHKASVQK